MERPDVSLTVDHLGLEGNQGEGEAIHGIVNWKTACINLEPTDQHTVLDLPQLHTKPPASALLSALDDLSLNPQSWESAPRNVLNGSTTPDTFLKRRKVKSDGVPSYLTRIVSSSLVWIEDDEQKEAIWEAASQRLSERSGRSAMGALTRCFKIPLGSEEQCDRVGLTLHEPALTGDSLGLKTWASSFLLAKRMCLLRDGLPALPGDATILELGSGTGLVGLAAAAVLQRNVLLTDLPDIVPNLETNAVSNADNLMARGVKAEVAVLDWSQPDSLHLRSHHGVESRSFALMVVADPIYSSDHPTLLVRAIDYHLSRDRNARVVVELPLRDGYGAERDEFRVCMSKMGMIIMSEGQETGFDDWSSTHDDELSEVRCWWSVWGWL